MVGVGAVLVELVTDHGDIVPAPGPRGTKYGRLLVVVDRQITVPLDKRPIQPIGLQLYAV